MMGTSQPDESADPNYECTENSPHWTTKGIDRDRGRCQEADNRAQRCCLCRRGRNPSEATTEPSCSTTAKQSAGKTAHEKPTMSERRTCGRANKRTESYGRDEEHEKPGVFHGF